MRARFAPLVVLVTTLIIGCAGPPSGAVKPTPYLGDTCTVYTEEMGLPRNLVHDIAVDSKGNVWLAGRSLTLFDGTNWIPYGEDLDTLIGQIALDSRDNLWLVAPYKGVAKFDRENWTWFDQEDGVVMNPGTITIDSQGQIWVGGQGGISIYDGESWRPYPEEGGLEGMMVRGIAGDTKGNHWFAVNDPSAEGSRIIGYDGEGWAPSDPFQTHRFVMTWPMVVDDEETLWIGMTWGVVRGVGKSQRIYTEEDGLPSNQVNDIWIDEEGRVWVATAGGVAVFDGQKWTAFTSRNSPLPTDYIYALAVDKGGNLWLGLGDPRAPEGQGGANCFHKP